MNHIKAIGFDLFNTLITVDKSALGEAVGRLTKSLRQSGFVLDGETFKQAHKQAALKYFKEARREGRETHNSLWISAALESQEYHVPPEDPRIGAAVDAYFSAFLGDVHLIPGTLSLMRELKGSYRLGLLSNFTHAPAARDLMDRVGLTPFFDVVLISGDLGFRKPHPMVFQRLVEELGVRREAILYVGDDPEPDITGAREAGIQPVWTTYVRDRHIPFAPGDPPTRTENPNHGVPRISQWEELLSLLK